MLANNAQQLERNLAQDAVVLLGFQERIGPQKVSLSNQTLMSCLIARFADLGAYYFITFIKLISF